MVQEIKHKISLIIPVYNEISHLEKVLKVIDSIPLNVEKELVIIDDASKDGSREVIKNIQLISSSVKFFQEKNMGKGAAIRKGIELATGNIIGIQDADFEYSVKDIPMILEPILNDDADVSYGSRFKKKWHTSTSHFSLFN